MQFRLTYRGRLKGWGSSTVEDKQAIRRQFHTQLKKLWQQSPLNEVISLLDPAKMGVEHHINLLANVGDFQFAPLVSDVHGWNTIAHLEILFMRPSQPGNLINHGGDLDNRLKALFDALRMPATLDELPKGDTPQADETPFYVLLKDDALVTSFNVITDRLLTPSENATDVELIILATIGVTRTSTKNLAVSG